MLCLAWTLNNSPPLYIKQCFIAKQQKFTWISTTRKYKKEKVHFLKVSISSPLEHIVEPIIHLTRQLYNLIWLQMYYPLMAGLVQIEETLLTPWYQTMHKYTRFPSCTLQSMHKYAPRTPPCRPLQTPDRVEFLQFGSPPASLIHLTFAILETGISITLKNKNIWYFSNIGFLGKLFIVF